VPVHSLAEIIASGQYHKPTLEKFFATAQSYEDGPNSADYKDRRMRMEEIGIEVANLMAKNQLDRWCIPIKNVWSFPLGLRFRKTATALSLLWRASRPSKCPPAFLRRRQMLLWGAGGDGASRPRVGRARIDKARLRI